MNSTMHRKSGYQRVILLLLAMFSVLLVHYQCSLQNTASASGYKNDLSSVSYARDIAPIMSAKCTPCHFPDEGRKKMLDTYTAVKANIDTILRRIQLEENERGFMPFKSKKPPLTEEEIELFKKWKSQGMSK